MFQALAKRIRRQKGEDSTLNLVREESSTSSQVQARTLRIEKEKQIGVCKYISQLIYP
jgi:hypothetical protein